MLKVVITNPGNNREYDDYYRPVQVIDYQNSTMAPKVIDYGHKATSVDAGAVVGGNMYNMNETRFSNEFRPVKTFDYGHASNSVNNRFGAGSQNVNAKKNNKKKNKNKRQQQQQQQQQSWQQEMDNMDESSPVQQMQEMGLEKNPESYKNASEDMRQQNYTLDKVQDLNDFDTNTSCAQATDAFDEISDVEDNMDMNRDDESPPPPPPPIFTMNVPYTTVVQNNLTAPPSSIFPSTAAANENIQKMPANHVQMSFPSVENQNTITVDEILLKPGRLTRPKKICVILRGPPGSGKSYVAKLIKDKEMEMGGSNPRILSVDDYFLIENDYLETCSKTGKKIPKKEILYEYDHDMEETYVQYLIKSFKKTITDNLYDFIIIDCNNNSLRTLNEFYCHSKDSGYMPYIVDLLCDVELCLSRNVHERSESDIQAVIDSWCRTPLHYIKLDISSLLENVVEMEDAEDMVMDDNANSETADSSNLTQPHTDQDDNDIENENEESNEVADADAAATSFGFLKSKWENDATSENLARLDGTSKLMHKRKTATMEDYLQIDDWVPPPSNTKGKKRVRWADIEEKRTQEKMRAIGFVVGQTDWKRMMDPHAGNRALNKTKYIERANRRR